MTPEQDRAVEQSKGPPKGATHTLGGRYYHERSDGQFLRYEIDTGYWVPAVEINSSSYLTGRLEPLDARNVWTYKPTPEEDEAWERLMASIAEKRKEHVMDELNKASDPVNHPSHYTQGGIECIDAIQASMSPEEFAGYLKGNCQKYIWRYKQKGGAQDLAKARWYLERLEAHVSARKRT